MQESFEDTKLVASDAIGSIADTWSDAGEEIVANSTDAAAALDEGTKNVIRFGLESDRTAKSVSKSTKSVRDSITPVLQALELEIALLGKTETEAGLYKLALDGASESQLRFARELYATKDAFEAQQAAQEAAAEAAAAEADAAARAAEDAKGRLFDVQEFGKEASRNLQSSFAEFLFDPFADGVEGMAANFGKVLQKMVAEAVAADILGRLTNAASGAGGSGGLGGLLGGFAGMFDAGGKVPAGSWGIAGENGPELVFGGQTVVSTADTAAAMGNTNNIVVNVPQQNSAADMRMAAGQGARDALNAMQGARRYG
jgi:hypothetical protein